MVDTMVPMPYEFDEQESIKTYAEVEALMRPRRNKFNARKVIWNGFTFDSRVESDRYVILRALVVAGDITDLEVHPKYKLLPSFTNHDGKKIRGISYTPDFRYVDGDGTIVVEDVKGGKATKTAAFVIKSKLFQWKNPDVSFRIVEM